MKFNKPLSILLSVALSACVQLRSMEKQPPSVCDLPTKLPNGPVFDLKFLAARSLLNLTESNILDLPVPEELHAYLLDWKKIISIDQLIESVNTGDQELFEFILKHGLRYGIAVNSQNDVGDTPLIVAARNNNSELATILIKSGSALDTFNISGMNPLKEAVKIESADMIKLLVQAGATITLLSLPERQKACIFSRRAGYTDIEVEVEKYAEGCYSSKGIPGTPMTREQIQTIQRILASGRQRMTPEECELFFPKK